MDKSQAQQYTDAAQIPPVPGLELSPIQLQERSFDLNRLYQISQVRESLHPQFDDMGYMKYNETNEMADISYLPRKKNKMDSRITTGITHEKDSSLVSMVGNFNFDGTIRVYYKDQDMYDLSYALTCWVRKSREDENYDEKRPIYYRNLFAQGTSFIQEMYVERYVPNKIIKTENIDFNRLDAIKWLDAGMKKVYDGCETHIVDGKKVFLEDIRQWDIRKQPGVYTVEYVPREYVESIWGKNPRWKNVPWRTTPASPIGYVTLSSIYSDWTFAEIDFTKCEVICAYRPFENRFQIYLNGVPMLPPGFPLTAISPSGLIPIAKGDLDLMSLFAYSKSIPAKTKIDQAVYDSLIRLMLIKFEQSAFVPRGNLSDNILSSNILMPGRFNNNLSPDQIPALIENPGITTADFSFVQLIQQQIDDKSVSSVLEGDQANGDMTLGQYLDMQKKQMLKLGSIFDAIINWEKQMIHLRTMNLIANGIKPEGQVKGPNGKMMNKYKDLSVKDTAGSANGTHIIKFSDQNYANVNTPENIYSQQQQMSDQTGSDVKISILNPQLLKEMLNDPDYKFYYEIVPVDKNNDKLTQALFVSMIAQAAQLFGPQSLNVQALKERYADVFGESFDDLFLNQKQMQLQQKSMMPQQALPGSPAGSPNFGAPGQPGVQSGPQLQPTSPNQNTPIASNVTIPNPQSNMINSMYK